MKKYLLGFAFGAIFFVACGHTEIKFPYKWGHVSPEAAWDFPGGKVLFGEEADDLELSDCKPMEVDDGNGGKKKVQKCTVWLYDEQERMIQDYKNTKQQLIDCQRGRSASSK